MSFDDDGLFLGTLDDAFEADPQIREALGRAQAAVDEQERALYLGIAAGRLDAYAPGVWPVEDWLLLLQAWPHVMRVVK